MGSVTISATWSDTGCTYDDPGSGPGVYSWVKMYYPNYSLGKYSTSSYGWVAQYENVDFYEFYWDVAPSATVAKSSGTPKSYTNTCSLSGASSQVFSVGTVLLHPFDNNWVHVLDCNLNAWVVNDPQYNFDKKYVDGWHMNAN